MSECRAQASPGFWKRADSKHNLPFTQTSLQRLPRSAFLQPQLLGKGELLGGRGGGSATSEDKPKAVRNRQTRRRS